MAAEVAFRASDGSEAHVSITVQSEAPPELGPSRAAEIIGVSGLTAENDTRYIDCPSLSFPTSGLTRVTVVADQIPTTQLRAVKDVWIQGRDGALMNSGPRSDGNDLLQIKRYPAGSGEVPDGITLRWVRFHDVSRPEGSSAHPDGIQVMAGLNGQILDSRFERCDKQPLFFRDGGQTAGGGPIMDWLVERCHIERAPTGFYAVRVAGNTDANVPTRLTVRDCTLTGNISVDRAAYDAGFESSGLVGGEVVING